MDISIEKKVHSFLPWMLSNYRAVETGVGKLFGLWLIAAGVLAYWAH